LIELSLRAYTSITGVTSLYAAEASSYKQSSVKKILDHGKSIFFDITFYSA